MTKISWLLGGDHYEFKDTIWFFQLGTRTFWHFPLERIIKLLAWKKNWSNQARKAASMATNALEDHRCSISSFSILTDINSERFSKP